MLGLSDRRQVDRAVGLQPAHKGSIARVRIIRVAGLTPIGPHCSGPPIELLMGVFQIQWFPKEIFQGISQRRDIAALPHLFLLPPSHDGDPQKTWMRRGLSLDAENQGEGAYSNELIRAHSRRDPLLGQG
jgi:hypothetical protein